MNVHVCPYPQEVYKGKNSKYSQEQKINGQYAAKLWKRDMQREHVDYTLYTSIATTCKINQLETSDYVI